MDAETEGTLAVFAGRLMALEYGLRTLIAVHPAPEGLHAVWQALLPTIADKHSSQKSVERLPNFHQGLIEGLGRLTGQIEETLKP